MIWLELHWLRRVYNKINVFGEIEVYYGGIQLHIDDVLPRGQFEPYMSILFVVFECSIHKIIVFMCLGGFVLKEHDS